MRVFRALCGQHPSRPKAPRQFYATRELGALSAAEKVDLLHLNVPSQAYGLDTGIPAVVVSHSCVATWWHTVRGTPLPDAWQWQRQRTLQGFARADAIVAIEKGRVAEIGRHEELLAKPAGVYAKLYALQIFDREPPDDAASIAPQPS